MNSKKYGLFFILVCLFLGLSAQNKQITLEDIWASGTFYPNRMSNLNAMQHTNQYTVLDYDRNTRVTEINLYDFSTLQKVKTLFNSANFSIGNVENYTFDKSEQKLLLATQSSPIYRHSFTAKYFAFNTANDEATQVTDKAIQEPIFSPNGEQVAYVFQNNIYVFDLKTKADKQITFDGEKNKIINGITDWVYEEEFAFVRAFDWSADGKYLAFLRFNESQVPEFSMDVYGSGLYPTQEVFKYPKAGENNSEVTLHIYNTETQKTTEIKLDAYYIPRLRWTDEASVLSVQTLNRLQNELRLILVDAQTTTFETILYENSKTYIDVTDNLTFLSDNSFLWTSEKDGFNHIYHYDKNGKLKNQITKGDWEVTGLYGIDEKNKTLFYQSTEQGSINRNIFSVKLNGKSKKTLTPETGTNSATFSPDYSLFINQFSSVKTAPIYTLNESKNGRIVKEILNNSILEQTIADYNLPQKEFFEITNSEGDKLNAYIIKPKDFNPQQKYPLLMYQYSGPGSQSVANSWLGSNDYWHMLLTERGYIVACVDGRGTGFKGADFKKCTYKDLGRFEVEDQVQAARILGAYDYIDESRIGIWGWSFGGFMSSNCIFQNGDVFHTAIAVAPVTSWRFYDTIYTERFMQTPQENPSGYDNNSPLTYAEKLKGKFLLVHGTADDNVHVQNAMILINKLVQHNKEFDWAIYPDKNHGIYGGYTRLQLYTKMTNFILENL